MGAIARATDKGHNRLQEMVPLSRRLVRHYGTVKSLYDNPLLGIDLADSLIRHERFYRSLASCLWTANPVAAAFGRQLGRLETPAMRVPGVPTGHFSGLQDLGTYGGPDFSPL